VAMKQFIYLVVSLAICSVGRGQTEGPKIGDPPPALGLEKVLQAPEGAKVNWSGLKGKVVVLEFWATWCGPCVAAIPHLNELAEQFKDKRVQFITVTDENEKTIAAFLKRKPIHAWVGLDTDKSMFKEYGISGIPHTVVVDKKGRIVAIMHPTMLTEQVLKDVLAGKKLALAQPAQGHRGGIRPGEVPYGEQQGPPALFQVLIRPTAADEQDGSSMASGNGGLTISRNTVFDVLSSCYEIHPVRVVTNCALPDGRFDFVVKTPGKDGELARNRLRQAVEATFDLHAKHETRDMPVYLLSIAKPSENLVPTVSTGGSSAQSGPGRMQAVNQPLGSLAWGLESRLGKPVLDKTGLTNHYDYELKWKDPGDEHPKPDVLIQAVREQLGLELKEATRPVEVLVVDKENNRDQ